MPFTINSIDLLIYCYFSLILPVTGIISNNYLYFAKIFVIISQHPDEAAYHNIHIIDQEARKESYANV